MSASLTQSVSNSVRTKVATLVSPETRQLVNFGERLGWDCVVLGNAPMPGEPVRVGEWLIVPAHQDTSPIPTRAWNRVQTIYAAGLRPKGFVVVHEAPLLLAAPGNEDKPHSIWQMPVLSPETKAMLGTIAGTLGTLAVSAVTVAGSLLVGGVMFVTAVCLALPLLVVGAMLDPILVAVTEDGYWVEIDRWWN